MIKCCSSENQTFFVWFFDIFTDTSTLLILNSLLCG
jgi:hypothetical protein